MNTMFASAGLMLATLIQDSGESERVRCVYIEIRDAAASKCGDVDMPKGGLLTFDRPASKLFTPGESERFLADIRRRAADLARRYEETGVAGKTAAAIEREMVKYYAKQHAEHWEQWIAGIGFAGFRDLAEAGRTLESLGADDSPLGECLRTAWRSMPLKVPESDVANKPKDDAGVWVPALVEAVRPLKGMMAELGKRPDRKRAALEVIIGKESDPFASHVALKPFMAALEKVDPAYRPRVRALVARLLDTCRRPFVPDALAALGDQWESDVHGPWKAMSSRFPFDPKSGEDVPLADVTALFGPKTGALAAVARDVEEVLAVAARLDPGRQPSPAYADAMKRVARLRRALFSHAGENEPDTIRVHFTVFTESAEHVRDYQVSVGTAPDMTHQHQARMSYQSDLKFVERVSSGAKLTAFVGKSGGETVVHDFSAKPWGLLHLMSAGKELPLEESPNRERPECTHARQWRVVDDEQVIHSAVKVAFRAESKDNWFDMKVFTDLKLPHRVEP